LEPIAVGELRIEPDDLTDMNKSELVKLARLTGAPAHRGLDRKVLISLLRGKKRKVRNKVDEYRAIITEFLRQHWDAVRSQVDVKCHGECGEHTDFQVLTCWKTNKDTLERYQ
jgi:hypothetical protein